MKYEVYIRIMAYEKESAMQRKRKREKLCGGRERKEEGKNWRKVRRPRQQKAILFHVGCFLFPSVNSLCPKIHCHNKKSNLTFIS